MPDGDGAGVAPVHMADRDNPTPPRARRAPHEILDFERPIEDLETKIGELEALSKDTDLNLNGEIRSLRTRLDRLVDDVFQNLSPWQQVQVARVPGRPLASDYIEGMCETFVELHGDRAFRDDPAVLTGLGSIEGRRVLIVAHRKGRDTKARLRCNFGSAHPEGYRKALRKMRLAEKFGIPIITLINTPGAYPGIGAEERGQAWAIAENIMEMSKLRVPVVVTVIGEGGSGGALGIGVGDRVLILEHAYYSVISPEGCAAILWKDGEQAPEAAEALKLTHLEELDRIPLERLLDERYRKFRAMGTVFAEPVSLADSEGEPLVPTEVKEDGGPDEEESS